MNISPFLWVPKAPKFVETLFLHHLLSSCIFPSSMAFGDFYKTDFVVKDLSDSLLFSKKVCLSDYLNTWFCKWYTLSKVKGNLSTFWFFCLHHFFDKMVTHEVINLFYGNWFQTHTTNIQGGLQRILRKNPKKTLRCHHKSKVWCCFVCVPFS